jgi:hypothetical protein
MKTLLLASVTALTLASSSAFAGDLSFGGYGEYALEAETFEFGLGADYNVNAVTFSSALVVTKPNGVDLDLDHVDLGVSYAASEQADIYGKVTLDSELKYDETTIGVAVRF